MINKYKFNKNKFLKNKFFFFTITLILSLLVFSCLDTASPVIYEFTTVRRGNIERSVSSSGTIHPVSSVRVLSQMSGKIEKVYVDYNDTVRRGDVLAELNTDVLRLRRDQQYATVQIARSNYRLQLISYNNQLALAERNLISEFELLTSLTNLENLEANLSMAETNLRVIETEINQHAFIVSPIDGVVLDRRVNEGDSVADSSSGAAATASLFTIAENLSEMQIEANIGELDVASIYRGQEVRFSLESLPGRRFNGTVENIRLVPLLINNVVSYTIMIKVDNHDGSLLPGMTCSVEFIVARSEDALLVSNAALRYQPTGLSDELLEELIFNADLEYMTEAERTAAINERNIRLAEQSAQEAATQNQRTGILAMLTGNTRNIRAVTIQGQARAQEGVRYLWFFNNSGELEAVRVRTGIITGSTTEIFALQDIEGRQFISRERQ